MVWYVHISYITSGQQKIRFLCFVRVLAVRVASRGGAALAVRVASCGATGGSPSLKRGVEERRITGENAPYVAYVGPTLVCVCVCVVEEVKKEQTDGPRGGVAVVVVVCLHSASLCTSETCTQGRKCRNKKTVGT